jgi:transcriptional regulator with XRE-family HTH domain
MVLSKKDMGEKIREARALKSKELGERFTQRDLAKALNISQGYLGDIENGRTYPNYVLLTKIAAICGVKLDFFNDSEIVELEKEYQMRISELHAQLESIERFKCLSQTTETDSNDRYIKERVYIEAKLHELECRIAELQKEITQKRSLFEKQLKEKEINSQSEENILPFSEKEIELINRFRKLSSASKTTLLTLLDNLEIVDTQSSINPEKEA